MEISIVGQMRKSKVVFCTKHSEESRDLSSFPENILQLIVNCQSNTELVLKMAQVFPQHNLPRTTIAFSCCDFDVSKLPPYSMHNANNTFLTSIVSMFEENDCSRTLNGKAQQWIKVIWFDWLMKQQIKQSGCRNFAIFPFGSESKWVAEILLIIFFNYNLQTKKIWRKSGFVPCMSI